MIAHGRQSLAEDLRGLATSFADSGVAALVLPPVDVRPDDLVSIGEGFAFLRARTDIDESRMAMLGFCGGGYQALLWGARSPPGLDAIVVFYGPLTFPERFQPASGGPLADILPVADDIRVPVQAHYGREDHIIALADVKALEQALTSGGDESAVFLYEEAEHGFWDRTHGHYHAEAARAAERRMFEFLLGHLRP